VGRSRIGKKGFHGDDHREGKKRGNEALTPSAESNSFRVFASAIDRSEGPGRQKRSIIPWE